MESIRSNGIITPITVRELEQDGQVNDPFLVKKPGERTFALVAGHRRVAAGQAAGLAGSHGVIARPSDDHNLITLVENMGRRELTSYEKALALKSFQERKGLSENKTAQLTGISQASINRLFNALKSPGSLIELWRSGQIGATAIVALKDYWLEFEQLENPKLIDNLQGLSQSEAVSLRNQLGSGTPLDTALIALQKNVLVTPQLHNQQPSQVKNKRGKPNTKQTIGDSQENAPFNQDALVTAIRDVFPQIKADKSESLYTSTLFYGNKDPKILWAAALFVSKGGDMDRAVDISKKVLTNRSIASLINRQVILSKLSASLYKKYWKKNREIKEYLHTVFR